MAHVVEVVHDDSGVCYLEVGVLSSSQRIQGLLRRFGGDAEPRGDFQNGNSTSVLTGETQHFGFERQLAKLSLPAYEPGSLRKMGAKEETRPGGGKTYRQQNGDERGRIAQALIRRE